jgi:hypothetical protein
MAQMRLISNAHTILTENLHVRDNFGDQETDVKLLLKLAVQKQVVGKLTGLNNSEYGLMALGLPVP